MNCPTWKKVTADIDNNVPSDLRRQQVQPYVSEHYDSSSDNDSSND
jgi:hypothetical protein